MKRVDMREWLRVTEASMPARFVLVALDLHANRNGRAWPSIPTLARETASSESTVRRALRELVRRGLITGETHIGASTVWQLPPDPCQADRGVTVAGVSDRPGPLSNGAQTPVTERAQEGIEGSQEGARALTISEVRQRRARARASTRSSAGDG